MDPQFPTLKLFVRVLLIGKSDVGKTSILLQSTENFFPTEHKPTIAVDCRIRTSMHDSRMVKLVIFDPPGKESLATLTPAYWYSVDAIIFVVDERPKSLQYIKDKIAAIFGGKEELIKKVIRILLVNKIDVITDKEYKTEIKQYAKENDMMFYKCCASDPTTLNEAFKYIVDKLYPNTAKEKMNKQTKFSKYRSQVKTFSCCRIF